MEQHSAEIETLEAFFSALLYGVYFVVFVFFVIELVKAKKRTAGKNSPNTLVFTLVASFLVLLVSTHLAVALAKALLQDESRVEPVRRVGAFVFRVIDAIGESILVWRTTFIWRANNLIFTGLMILLVSGTSFGILSAFKSQTVMLVTSSLLTSTCVLCAGLSIWRYVYLSSGKLAPRPIMILKIATELGCIYSLFQVVSLILVALHIHDGYSIVDNICAAVYASLATITLTFVLAGSSPVDKLINSPPDSVQKRDPSKSISIHIESQTTQFRDNKDEGSRERESSVSVNSTESEQRY